jgi:hypothetical protein
MYTKNENPKTGAIETYAYIRQTQMDYYEWAIEAISKAAGLNGTDEKIDHIAFFHIPVYEFALLYADKENIEDFEGKRRENATAFLLGETGGISSPPAHYTQMEGAATSVFNTLRDNGCIGIFVGHDHVNNFRGTWDGVYLSYGRGSGYSTYPYLRADNWFGRLVANIMNDDPVYAFNYERGVLFIDLNGIGTASEFRVTEFERERGFLDDVNW